MKEKEYTDIKNVLYFFLKKSLTGTPEKSNAFRN